MPKKLTFTEEAEAFERSARFLERQGQPVLESVEEQDPAYRRGVVNGLQLAVMQLEERARAMREMAKLPARCGRRARAGGLTPWPSSSSVSCCWCSPWWPGAARSFCSTSRAPIVVTRGGSGDDAHARRVPDGIRPRAGRRAIDPDARADHRRGVSGPPGTLGCLVMMRCPSFWFGVAAAFGGSAMVAFAIAAFIRAGNGPGVEPEPGDELPQRARRTGAL